MITEKVIKDTVTKVNCWEFMKCGKHRTVDCPVIAKGAGRLCWMVAGTVCNGEVQGSFVEKIGNCRKCDFYLYMDS